MLAPYSSTPAYQYEGVHPHINKQGVINPGSRLPDQSSGTFPIFSRKPSFENPPHKKNNTISGKRLVFGKNNNEKGINPLESALESIRSSSREVRIRVGTLFSVDYFSRGTLSTQKWGEKGHLAEKT